MELHGSSFSDHACNPVIVCQSHLPSLIDNEKADTGTIGHHTLFIQHRLIDHWTAFQRSRKLEVLDWKWTPDGHLIDTWWTPDGHLMDTWTILKESNKQSTPAVSHMFFLQVAQRMAQLRATPPSATSGLRNEMTQEVPGCLAGNTNSIVQWNHLVFAGRISNSWVQQPICLQPICLAAYPNASKNLCHFFPESAWAKGSSKSGGLLYICTSSHIFTHLHASSLSLSLSLSPLPLSLSLSLSCPLSRSLFFFFFSLLRPQAVPMMRHDMATFSHEMRFECQKLRCFSEFTSAAATFSHEARFKCQTYGFGDFTTSPATLSHKTRFECQKPRCFCDWQPFRSKIEGFLRFQLRRQPFRTKWG